MVGTAATGPLLTRRCGAARCRDKLRPYINNDGQIKHTFSRQLVAEFLGTMLFQIFGGAAPPNGALAAPANGFALVAISERPAQRHLGRGPAPPRRRMGARPAHCRRKPHTHVSACPRDPLPPRPRGTCV
jgi:hypothetical protein